MKKIIFTLIAFCFFIFKIAAQSYNQIYNQNEQLRLTNASITEDEIQNFISQNLNNYDFTEVINNINKVKDENGQPLKGSDYQATLISAKKARLRDVYFEKNPEKLQFYYASPLQQCVNGGFEDNGGSVNSYNFFYNKISSGWSIFNNNPTTPITASPTAKATLVDNSANDPVVGIPRVNTGTHAIRLGNQNYIGNEINLYHVTKMTRTFTVNESSISFAFALVFEDGGNDHVSSNTNPYYQVKLFDASNQIVFTRNVMANPSNPLFQKYNKILYTNWLCEKISTSRLLGQTVRLEITLSDCGQGGHWGYGYFDDFCGFDCTIPSFNPGITLNPLKKTCPTFPLPVSGNIALPSNASFTNVTLQILDMSNNVVGTKIITSAPGGVFSTDLNYSDFYPAGPNSNTNFNIRALLNYTVSGLPQTPVSVNNTNPPGPDVSFTNCASLCYEIFNFTANQPITNSMNYQAICCILSESVIYPNLTVDFRAGEYINLKPGFYTTAYNTGNFHAYIARCDENKTTINFTERGSKTSSTDNISIDDSTEIKISPNPASTYINIDSGKQKIVSWNLYDFSGRNILNGNSNQVNVQSLPKANYILKINTANKQVTKKVSVK
ncbi:T9SS type A sorting domain-containing protein [Chryseobacterium hispalense]|uniref:T9SS type A sorting domain-containing protein n=1 Tax=Chryseobacterium hispalense TaxID=1453492 RepID=UPI00049308F2|nr:T9SS type A sorting domain-containing protein [Chryseobacterium hispalense]